MSSRAGSRRSLVASIAFVAAFVVLALIFHRPLVAWFTGKRMGDREGAAVTARAGPFTLSAALDPDPPGMAGDALLLRVFDASGEAVDDASVDVVWDMPAMGAMAEMKGAAKVSHETGGRYRAEFDVPMGGSWTLLTTVSSPAGRAEQSFTMTVGSKGLTSAEGAAAPAEVPVVQVDEARRQLIGVRTGKVVEGPMRASFRAVGRVAYDESKLADVSLKVRGWITRLFVDETGQRVGRGQPLFTLYSPELYDAEQDFLLAARGGASPAASDGGTNRVAYLATAARQRLRLLGLDNAQIDALAKADTPSESVTFDAPASGFVIEKNVVEGAAVDAGARLYRIAALDRVWVEAEVYEADFAHVKVGQRADVTLDYLPGRSYEAKVAYVYPYLDPAARTGRVRIELSNRGLDLRPGMYATVTLSSDLGTRLQVPAAAVVYTGPRRLVFVDLGEGRFRVQEVTVGAEAGGMYEVLSGLEAGDVVATSGVFLIAAEARLGTAAKYWEGGDGGAPKGDRP